MGDHGHRRGRGDADIGAVVASSMPPGSSGPRSLVAALRLRIPLIAVH